MEPELEQLQKSNERLRKANLRLVRKVVELEDQIHRLQLQQEGASHADLDTPRR